MSVRDIAIAPETHVVVGSGAAGVSCAAGLLAKGVDVAIVDVGVRAESEAMQRVQNLRRTAPQFWPAEDLQAFRDPVNASTSGVLKKLVYGSGFAYGDPYGVFQCERHHVKGDFSFARGGLTNAWGACMLPCRASEIEHWPVSFATLEPHYRAILEFVPLAAWHDRLETQFPIFTDRPVTLRNGPQAEAFLRSCGAHERHLEEAGIYAGNSRLAVHSATPHAEGGCVYCGLCMYGCPYELIYKSDDTLCTWLGQGRLRYYDRLFVEQVAERGQMAILRARDLSEGGHVEIKCARIYLAAGTISTAKIVLESLRYYDKPVGALDSQMFLTPIFKFRSTPGFTENDQFTLTQLFLEVIDRGDCRSSVHFQIYPYNDLVGRAIERMFPRHVWRSPVFKNHVLSRIMIMQGFLDSKYSASLEFTLTKNSEGSALHIRGIRNPLTGRVIRKVLWKIARNAPYLRALSIPVFPRLGFPGQSYHCGGSFPMSRTPHGLETDTLGCVAGFDRVHVVDASVLPSIPPTTITFTAMANAHRIACQTPAT